MRWGVLVRTEVEVRRIIWEVICLEEADVGVDLSMNIYRKFR